MGRDLERGDAGRNQWEFRYVVRYGVGFAGQSHQPRLCGRDGDSVQEPALPGDETTGVGNHSVSRNLSQERGRILAAGFVQSGGQAGAGSDTLWARRNLARTQHRTDSLRRDARLSRTRHSRPIQPILSTCGSTGAARHGCQVRDPRSLRRGYDGESRLQPGGVRGSADHG